MTFEAFLDLITETIGWPIRPGIIKTLATYGTYWVLDRERLSLRRVVMTGDDDLINVRSEIQHIIDNHGKTDDDDPINGMVDKRYSKAVPEIPAMKNSATPFDNVSHRYQKKSRFGFLIPNQK
jgi:hypothetical protein